MPHQRKVPQGSHLRLIARRARKFGPGSSPGRSSGTSTCRLAARHLYKDEAALRVRSAECPLAAVVAAGPKSTHHSARVGRSTATAKTRLLKPGVRNGVE